MAKERDGSINIYGSLQAKTEDGYVAYTDGIAHENEDGTKTSLDQLLKNGVGGGIGGIIDIDKLFQDNWSGTPIPDDTTTIVENLYFNQNLSIEEVVKVLQNANLQMEDVGYGDLKGYYITYPDSYLGEYGKITYLILRSEYYDVWLIANFLALYSIAIGATSSESQILFSSKTLPDFGILLEGWNTSITMPIDYNNRIYFEKPKIKQNVSLLPIVSSTPFLNSDKNPDEKIVYRLKEKNKNIVSGYEGTVVPNSGALEKIYFNLSLTSDKVSNILNNLTWINASNLGQSGFEFYPVLAYMNGSYPYVLAFKKYTEAIGSHSIGDINGAIINFANMETIEDFYIFASGGWQTFTNPYPINATLLSELSGIPIGTQNDIISSLISKTEFEEEYVSKYTYWVYKDKWVKLLTNEDGSLGPSIVDAVETLEIDFDLAYTIDDDGTKTATFSGEDAKRAYAFLSEYVNNKDIEISAKIFNMTVNGGDANEWLSNGQVRYQNILGTIPYFFFVWSSINEKNNYDYYLMTIAHNPNDNTSAMSITTRTPNGTSINGKLIFTKKKVQLLEVEVNESAKEKIYDIGNVTFESTDETSYITLIDTSTINVNELINSNKLKVKISLGTEVILAEDLILQKIGKESLEANEITAKEAITYSCVFNTTEKLDGGESGAFTFLVCLTCSKWIDNENYKITLFMQRLLDNGNVTSSVIQSSNLLITSGGVYNALQNVKVETDSTPTQDSTNAISSGGVFNALQEKQNKITVIENADGTVDIIIPTE